MPAKTAPTGYSRLQITLHWLVFALIAQQYLFKDAMSAAWDRITDGLEAGFDPLVLAHVAGGALVMIFALWRLTLRARRGVPPAIEASKVWAKRSLHLGMVRKGQPCPHIRRMGECSYVPHPAVGMIWH